MFGWAITFLIVAIVAALLGFSGVAGVATNIAWILFVVGLILFVVFLLMGRLATAGGVLALFILAFGVAGLLSGLESHVSITADSLEETYNFNLALVLDSLKYPFK